MSLRTRTSRLAVVAVLVAAVLGGAGCRRWRTWLARRRAPAEPEVTSVERMPPAPLGTRVVENGLAIRRVQAWTYPLVKVFVDELGEDGAPVDAGPREAYGMVFDDEEPIPAADTKRYEVTGEAIYLVVVLPTDRRHRELVDAARPALARLAESVAELEDAKLAIVGFDGEAHRLVELSPPRVAVAELAGVTSDGNSGDGALLDALRTAKDMLGAKGVPDDARKLVVVLADGDSPAVTPEETQRRRQLIANAVEEHVIIDAIVGPGATGEAARALGRVAHDTEGVLRRCARTGEVAARLDQVAAEVARELVILFTSAVPGNGREHTLRVIRRDRGLEVRSNTIAVLTVDHGAPEVGGGGGAPTRIARTIVRAITPAPEPETPAPPPPPSAPAAPGEARTIVFRPDGGAARR